MDEAGDPLELAKFHCTAAEVWHRLGDTARQNRHVARAKALASGMVQSADALLVQALARVESLAE